MWLAHLDVKAKRIKAWEACIPILETRLQSPKPTAQNDAVQAQQLEARVESMLTRRLASGGRHTPPPQDPLKVRALVRAGPEDWAGDTRFESECSDDENPVTETIPVRPVAPWEATGGRGAPSHMVMKTTSYDLEAVG